MFTCREMLQTTSKRWGKKEPRFVEITPRVVVILQMCDLVRFSRSSWLYAHVKKQWPKAHLKTFQEYLKRMCARGLIDKLDTKTNLINALHQPDVYVITKLGQQTLYDAGFPLTKLPFGVATDNPKWFPHALGICDVAHSFLLGTSVISHDTIFSKAPQATFKIHIDDKLKGLTPDALIGLEYPVDPTDGKSSKRFIALEFDTGSEDLGRIEKKFVRYLEIMKQGLYRTHWGLPNIYPLFVTSSQYRLDNMIRLLKECTGSRGNSKILFQRYLGDTWKKPPATPYHFTEPSLRAGYPPEDLRNAPK